MPKLWKWFAALTVLCAAGVLFFYLTGLGRKTEASPDKVVIGTPILWHSLPLFVAASQGFFEANHLDVTLAKYEVGALAAEDLLGGKLDFAAMSDFVAVNALFRRPDLRIVTIVARANDCRVIARKDRGIIHPTDLSGKSIGVHHGTAGEFLLSRFLLLNGVDERRVRIVDVKNSEAERALEEGRVDAAFAWPPNAEKVLKRLGQEGVSIASPYGMDYHWLLVSLNGTLERRPQTARRLLSALREAEEFLKKDPARARDLARSQLSLSEDAHALYTFEMGLRQPLLLQMEEEARWLMKTKLVPNQAMPNYLNTIYFTALDAVNPAADTVAH